MPRSIPKRWERYLPIGKKIEGTRFIAFKVPLKESIAVKVQREKRLDDRILLEQIPNLGLIIDLTDTARYYDPEIFLKEGIEYKKIMIPGKRTPPQYLRDNFIGIVNEFMNSNKNNDKLIGVHCTHGINRTGYLICYYMISQMTIKPKEAMDKFAHARGYQIERKNYIESLQNLKFTDQQDMKDWRNRAERFLDKTYQNQPSRDFRNSRARKRPHDDNSYRGHNTYENFNEEVRPNSYYPAAERYMDYHCTMSSSCPRNLSTDYYNKRPKFDTKRYRYNRLSKDYKNDA